MTRGRIFAVVGPSGAGKDSLMAAAQLARPDLAVVRRVITRPEAAGGEGFDGVTPQEFDTRQAAGEFALDWSAHGLRYGIPRTEVAGLAAGRDVLFNGSRAALAQARSLWPDLRVILVTAPDAVLAARLAARGRETLDDIAERLERAAFTLPDGLDVIVVHNAGNLADGVTAFLAALQSARG
jgi:ribose 1,5-bisphosphokinase